MKRSALSALLLGILCWSASGPAPAQGDKGPGIKEIMGRVNKPTGIYFEMGKELKTEDPMWAELGQQAREMAKLADALTKTTPPKGDKASWDALTKAYAANAVALEKAVAAKDQAGAKTAHAKLGGMACMACHKAHRKD